MPKVYKYRHFQDDNHIALLSNQEIYLSDPAKFSDPNDCAVDVRLGPSPPSRFLASLKKAIKKQYPHVSKTEIDRRVDTLIREDQVIDATVFRRQVEGSVGICSFGSNPGSPKMWSKYSRSHTGFVVAFDFDRLNMWCQQNTSADKGRGYFLDRVEYPPDPPLLNVSDMSAAQIFQTAVTTKRRSYRWEDEYRMVSNDAVAEARQVPEEAIDSVAVGRGAATSDIQLTRDYLQGYAKPVRLLRATGFDSGLVVFREIGLT